MNYLHRLSERLETLHLYGLDERRSALQESGERLDPIALYQPLNTTTRVPVEDDGGENDILAARLPKTRALTALEAVGRERSVLLRGAQGGGKSSFLRYLVLSLLERSPEGERTGMLRLEPAWTHGWLFPLWVDLRDLSRSGRLDGTAAGLCAHLAADLGIYADQLCRQILAPGGVLLLLDGLEEAPAAAAELLGGLEAIASIAEDVRPSCVFVTSRPYVAPEDLRNDPLSSLAEVTLAPWILDQMEAYAREWYAELRRRDWVDEDEARDLPGHLCSALRRTEVRELAQRPAMMATIALLHTLREGLPADQGMFYHALIALILATWSDGKLENERDLRQAFDLESLSDTVAQLTYQGTARLEDASDLVLLSERDLRTALVEICRDGRWETVNELVTRVSARPSLLVERDPGCYAFASPGLQAYVAARHLVSQPDLPGLVVELAESDLDRWRQPIAYAASRLAWLGEDLPAALSLVDALVGPSVPGDEKAPPDKTAWRMAWVAGEMLAYLGQSFDLGDAAETVSRVRGRLVTLLGQGLLDPRERLRAGRSLDHLPRGDTRQGVSSPGSVWCEVPEAPFWLGEGDEARLVEMGAFWIARYPVTNTQYLAFVEATGHRPPSHWQGGRPPAGLGNHPVVYVTWDDVMAYCAWWNVNIRGGQLYVWQADQACAVKPVPPTWQARLPSSAEWEKAARGGLRIPGPDGEPVDNPLPHRRFPWGDSWVLSSGETRGDETRCNVSESNIGETTPVGMYLSGASPYGVLDAAGNVWEWCNDWAGEERRYKVRRGGAFRYTHDQARCSALDRSHPDLSWPYVGFRPVLGPPIREEDAADR